MCESLTGYNSEFLSFVQMLQSQTISISTIEVIAHVRSQLLTASIALHG